jgi:hypothetical protein
LDGKIKFDYEKIKKMGEIGGYDGEHNKAKSEYVFGHTFFCKICKKN